MVVGSVPVAIATTQLPYPSHLVQILFYFKLIIITFNDLSFQNFYFYLFFKIKLFVRLTAVFFSKTLSSELECCKNFCLCFFAFFYMFFLHWTPDFRYSSLNIVRLIWGRITNKLAMNWTELNFIKTARKSQYSCINKCRYKETAKWLFESSCQQPPMN